MFLEPMFFFGWEWVKLESVEMVRLRNNDEFVCLRSVAFLVSVSKVA